MPALLLAALIAADPAPQPERLTYRVTGLFAPDRETDLRAAFADLPDFKLLAVDFDAAEVTLEFAPAKLFPNQKPERVAELVGQKLRGVDNTFDVKPRRTAPRDKLERVTIEVAGLDCRACCLAAYEIVAKVDGVEQATASFKDRKVTALIDPAKTTRAALEDALRKRNVKVGPP